MEQGDWQVERTEAGGIKSLRLRGTELLAAPADPRSSTAARWEVNPGREERLTIKPARLEVTQAMVWPFRYEPDMKVVVRGADLMPFTTNQVRPLGVEYTVRLEWTSSEVAISFGWDPDRLAPANLTLKSDPARLELELGAIDGGGVRPESWWVQVRDANRGAPIKVVDYNPAWVVEFERQKAQITRALGDQVMALEHAGSTSVPGLAAKPVIDMYLALRSLLRPQDIRAMAALGYEYLGEAGLKDRDFFIKESPPPCHLHCYPAGHGEWDRHLVFRDWLRSHPEGARAYGKLKRELALRFAGDRMAYTEAKSDFIETALAGKLDETHA
jgi:GrpB-like predicted nucleotidyltransferase (UPF0157 family)